MIRPAVLVCALVFSASNLQAQSVTDASGPPSSADVESMEACLAETVMVAEPGHCTGLLSDACITSGGLDADCLDREEAVWAAILREHWPFSCQTCTDGLSLSRSARAARVVNGPACRATEIEQARCLMQETARQAGIVFFH